LAQANFTRHLHIKESREFAKSNLISPLSYEYGSTRLIDFPESGEDPKVVTNWVAGYFFPEVTANSLNNALMGASPVIQTEKPPLVLQVCTLELPSPN
jgi:hypothetical protein